MKIHIWNDMPWEEVTPVISRKIITGTNEMATFVRLKKGAVVPEHSHVSEQISYVTEGALRFTIDAKEIDLAAGQVLVIPPNVPHAAVALEDTLEMDLFSPIRQDWLDGTDTYFHRK